MYKKLLTTLFCTCMAAFSFAQDTLTAANANPVAGDAFITINSNPNGISPGGSGASQVWNFVSLDTASIDTGIATPCAFVYPTCDWATGSNLAIATESQNVRNYIYVDNSRYSEYGIYYSTTQYFYYTDPMDVLRFPFTYLTTFTDSYAGVVSFTPTGFSTPLVANVKGNVTVTCDGWGTLVLPGGTITSPGRTYSNVLRVHSTQVYVDSADIFGTGLADSFQLDTYTWYISGTHTGIMTVSYAAQLNPPGAPVMDTTVTFISRPLVDAVPTMAGIATSLQLYPNPAADELNIKFTVQAGEQVRITLADLLGREVAVISNEYVQGTENIHYNTASLPNGIYLVRLESGTETVTRKIEVR